MMKIIHFNDIYHVKKSIKFCKKVEFEKRQKDKQTQEKDFKTQEKDKQTQEEYFKTQEEEKDLILNLFSGDVFAPSLESSITKGQVKLSCSALIMRLWSPY